MGTRATRENYGRRGKGEGVKVSRRRHTFQVLVVTDTSVHALPVPFLDLLHVPHAGRSALATQLPKLVESDALATVLLESISFLNPSLYLLSTRQVAEVAYVGVREQWRRVGRDGEGGETRDVLFETGWDVLEVR